MRPTSPLTRELHRVVRTVAAVAVAVGADKAAAIRGALRTGIVRVLVTDRATARAVLAAA